MRRSAQTNTFVSFYKRYLATAISAMPMATVTKKFLRKKSGGKSCDGRHGQSITSRNATILSFGGINAMDAHYTG